MPETRHELAVGESVIIDDYLLTVEDIRGGEVLFRIEHVPGLQSPVDAQMPAGGAGEEREEFPTTGMSRRARPR